MMLPLLPVELIDVDAVDLIVARWRAAFYPARTDFDELRNSLLSNYIRPDCRFVKTSGVCGRSSRTNNSAEISHAALNSSVRVSGAVSLDMFLFAIEGQMRNTTREINACCPSHSKTIYERRNTLLSLELSDFLTGRQWILRYLDHCAKVMEIKNANDIKTFMEMKRNEAMTSEERRWIFENRERVYTLESHCTINCTQRNPKAPMKSSEVSLLGPINANVAK